MTLKDQLIRDEGKVRYAYQDSEGYWTIGVGRLIDKRKGGGLSDNEISYLLDNDIKRVIPSVDAEWPWLSDVDEVRRSVVYNMAFSLGIEGVAGFKKFLKHLQAHDYELASYEMLDSKWEKQVGDRATRLSRQMRTGQWV